MKTNKIYVFLSIATILAVTTLSMGAPSFAQSVPLSCSAGVSPVNVNQAAVFTAAGGNGTYAWSGTNLNITNAAGTQFAVSYPTAGTYTVVVSSAGASATCNVTVVNNTTTGALTCSPAVQNVTLGQTASVSATGGNGTYTWSSPDITITNPNGSGFSVNYASTGLKTMTVTSGGAATTCAINVLASTGVPVPPVTTPGLPDTGGGFGQ